MWRMRLVGSVVALVMATGSAALAQTTPAGDVVAVEGLSGTLLKPAGATVAALIIAGSGPTDRDGNGSGLKSDAYRHLADGLAKVGIASLRFDKRGIGQSLNDAKGVAVKEEVLTIETSAADVATLAVWLDKQAGFKRILVVGHSEGALLALLAAKRAKIDRLVLVSPAGAPLGQVLRKQFSRQPMAEDLAAEIDRVLTALETGKETGPIKPPVDRLFRPSVQPFLKSVLTLDPAPLVKSIAMPILVIGGGADLQVGRLDLEALIAARSGVIMHWEPGMTHMLKEVRDDDPSQIAAYTDPTVPVMGTVIARIAQFAME